MKNRKKFSGLALIISIIAAFVIGFGSAFGTIFFTSISSKNSSSNDLQRFMTVYNDINNNYYKKVNSHKLINSAIDGMVSTLDDPYTEYISTDNYESFNDNISGNITGIGVVVSHSDTGMTVVSVVDNSPAKKAGLKPKDIITKIDNKDTSKMSLKESSNAIRGKIGTSVKLTVKRQSKTFVKTVTRKKIEVSSVSHSVNAKDKSVGYIQITEFTNKTAKDLKKNLKALDNKKIKKVIIDLRSNPGGQLDQVTLAASMFLKNGSKILSTQDRNKEVVTYKAKASDNGGYKFNKPVVLLVDGNTASAAEVFTAALNENIKTPIVGMKTFGKGIVQTVAPVDNTSEFKFTTSKWLTPKNNWIHHKGIKPTYEVKYNKNAYINFTNKKTYKLGDTNSDVKNARRALTALGYPLEDDDKLDNDTVNALKEFQNANNLQVSGDLDVKTKDALISGVAQKLQDNDPMLEKALKIK